MYEIVVVGTSLGGLNALQVILQALPLDFPLPLAIAQHRSKEPGDGLAQLLAIKSALSVREVEDKQPIAAHAAYLAPADYHLLVEKGSFELSTEEPVQFARPSIDVLFESAADAYGSAVVGVVLTGANGDGARGATRIKQCGGLLVVQDPADAESPAMPQAVIAAVNVDRVLPLSAIPRFLCELCATAWVPMQPQILATCAESSR